MLARVIGDGCSVRCAGIELRHNCAGCNGHPQSGQQQYRRRGLLYLEGSPADAIFAVIEGYVREIRVTLEGKDQTVRLVGPGGLTGVEALRGGNFASTAEAMTKVRACRVSRGELLRFLEDQSDRRHPLLTYLVGALGTVGETVMWLGTLDARSRILALLERFAEEAGSLKFKLPITRLEFATLVGLSHSTISRTLHQLHREGRIRLDGRRVELPVLGGEAQSLR